MLRIDMDANVDIGMAWIWITMCIWVSSSNYLWCDIVIGEVIRIMFHLVDITLTSREASRRSLTKLTLSQILVKPFVWQSRFWTYMDFGRAQSSPGYLLGFCWSRLCLFNIYDPCWTWFLLSSFMALFLRLSCNRWPVFLFTITLPYFYCLG